MNGYISGYYAFDILDDGNRSIGKYCYQLIQINLKNFFVIYDIYDFIDIEINNIEQDVFNSFQKKKYLDSIGCTQKVLYETLLFLYKNIFFDYKIFFEYLKNNDFEAKLRNGDKFFKIEKMIDDFQKFKSKYFTDSQKESNSIDDIIKKLNDLMF